MRKLVVAAAALPALLFVSAGFAADLPRRYAQAYAPPLMPIFTWTGLYGGIVGAYGFGDFNGRGLAQTGSADGALIGGTLGYNYQLQNNIVVGVEGDASYADVGSSKATGPITAKTTLNYENTVRGRVGYAANRILFYATGGYAGGNIHYALSGFASGLQPTDSTYLNGYAVGAGVEYAVMPNLSAKAEYLYTDLGQADSFVGTPYASRVGLSTSNIRLGVNYHF